MRFEPGLASPGGLPLWLDLGAVALGAIFGATLASARKAPLIGVLILAVVGGFGGGLIRDLLLNAPINALVHGEYVTTVAVSAVVGAVLGNRLLRPLWLFYILDAIVMGMFVVIGTEKSMTWGMPTSSAILIGILSAISGGIMGDLMLGVEPAIMTRGPWQASIAMVGALWFAFWNAQPELRLFAELSTISLCVFIRAMSLWKGWEAPTPDDLKPTEWVKRTKARTNQRGS